MEFWVASENEWQVVRDLLARGLHVHGNVDIGYEADIVLPSLGIVAEYDSHYYHEGTAPRDEEQRLIGKAAGYRVVRLREPGLPVAHPDDISLWSIAGRGGLVLDQIASHLLGLAATQAA